MTLLREELSEERQRRLSDRSDFASWVDGIRTQIAREAEQTREYIKDTFELHGRTYVMLTELGEKLDTLHEQAGVPARAIPTIDELIDEARTEPAKRKLLQQTLAELEFENTEVDFN